MYFLKTISTFITLSLLLSLVSNMDQPQHLRKKKIINDWKLKYQVNQYSQNFWLEQKTPIFPFNLLLQN